jgi:hypothetical protein
LGRWEPIRAPRQGDKEEYVTREESYNEVREMFGGVPHSIRLAPDQSLEPEWRLFERVHFAEGSSNWRERAASQRQEFGRRWRKPRQGWARPTTSADAASDEAKGLA